MSDWTMLPRWDETRVVHVEEAFLAVEGFNWALATQHRRDIDVGWAKALARNPAYFNGIIHLTRGGELSPQLFSARLFPTDFKTYLFWRESGFADRTVRDVFGSALIRSSEGYVILGRQRAGNVNAGLTYLPGGFIDARDVIPDTGTGGHKINIDASILREVSEETGLALHDLDILPGYYLTFTGPQISLARELVASRRSAEQLRLDMMRHIDGDPKSELTDIMIIRSKKDLDGLAMPPYAQALMGALFP